ncbi:ABC transporter substrate-binding protein [Mongoliimonas terrestris]|uniref:ABC transporter substrate-binding protein n=1 Tax=Mongoliimonas terrestris TaxID=1709001 RepID=UPI0009499BC1|nr:ABC transporter substrate-binding protein [Mongoliimonas terrestris]
MLPTEPAADRLEADVLTFDRRSFLAAVMAFGAGTALMSVGLGPAAAAPGGVIRFGIGDSFAGEKLDPATVQNGGSLELVAVIYETLVRRGPDWTFKPWLAESWTLSDDAKTWTFTLRKGVLFHDGSPLTTKDVVYTIKRHLDETLGSALQKRLSASFTPDGLEIVDDHVFKINMTRPDTLLVESFSRFIIGIIKEGTVGEVDVSTAVGTGPFKLTAFAPGEAWEVERFEGYWMEGVPAAEKIQCVYIPDQSAKVQAVTSGAMDIVDGVDAAVLKDLKTDPSVRIAFLPNAQYWGIFLSQEAKPFDDVRVRRAIKLAVDRKLILDTVYQGNGTITPDVPVPPGDPIFPEAMGDGAQDIEAAKALLAEAGYPDGIEFELFTSPLLPGMVDLAVVFAESVKPAGIKVSVNQWPTSTYWDQIWLKRPAYVDYMNRRNAHDAMDLTFANGSPYNGSKFDPDGALRAAIEAAIGEPDKEKQVTLYKAALTRVAMESGTVIPCYVHQHSVLNAAVAGNPYEWEMPRSLFALAKEA